MHNRIGRFSLPDKWFLASTDPNWFERCKKFFRDMVVIACDYNTARRTLEYTAVGPMFSEVPEGAKPLRYSFRLDREGHPIFDIEK